MHLRHDDAERVIQIHTLAGIAIAAHEREVLPLNQTSMCFCYELACHDTESVALDLGERRV